MSIPGNIAEKSMLPVESNDRSVDKISLSNSISAASSHPTVVSKDTDGSKEMSIVRTIQVSASMSDSGVASDISSSDSDKPVATFVTRVPSPVCALDHSYPRSYPTDIKIVQVGERKWMCDICKATVFENFVEACMHEMVCKPAGTILPPPPSCPPTVQHARTIPLPAVGPSALSSAPVGFKPALKQKPAAKPLPMSMLSKQKPPPSPVMATRLKPKPSKIKTKSSLDVSLIPENRTTLSDYNYILTQNIEFFEVTISYNIPLNSSKLNMDGLPKSKIGLRCIHCSANERHVTAASFFPSSTSSISSGMGTIGSRHFIGGKCPHFPKDILEILVAAKKKSQQQTRSPGKLGLDAYCREFAKSHKIFDHDAGGIFIAKSAATQDDGEELNVDSKISAKVEKADIVTETVSKEKVSKKEFYRKDPIPDRNDPFAFKESAIEHFWECSHCNSLPFQWRASGSVIFCAATPTIELVGKHLSVCQGKKPLRIPRNASIKIRNGERYDNKCSVIVQWNNDDGLRKSGRSKRQSFGPESTKKKRRVSIEPKEPVNLGVEDETLAFPDDKSLTTDFAHFTVLQLKKCYLTKAGGSRGNCPLGYPGLACAHCAGDANERRFFYTSADHLRNSFSHIPSHLMMCNNCPSEVKSKIEDYKAVRNKQKSQLKAGDHKVFIDRVWERLHGPGGGVIESPTKETPTVEYMSDDDRSHERVKDSVSVEFLCDPSDDYLNESLDGRYLECKEIAIETSQSAILSSSDKKISSNYAYYTLLQLAPKQYSVDSDENLYEITDNEENQESKNQKAQEMQNQKIFPKIVAKTIDTKSNDMVIDEATNTPAKFQDADTTGMCKIESTTKPVDQLKNDGLTDSSKDDNEGAIEQVDVKPSSDEKVPASENSGDEREEFVTLVCKHCMNENMDSDFLPRSGEELRASFAEIPKHLMSCSKCPQNIKSKLSTLKALRPVQEAMLKRGAAIKLTNSVWNRLENYFADPDDKASEAQDNSESYSSDILTTSLLSESDRTLVSEFTFYTMEQMEPCILQNSGNGSRSMFAFGFPGLGCKHCSGKPTARKFFYRTSEILSGNYAHIPNHVMSCKHCPFEVKQILSAKKKLHQAQKQRLKRGSQRVFFNNCWDRLHRKSRKGSI